VSKLRPDDEVAVEVTGNTRLFYDAVRPHVARVVVVNPSQFHVIRQSVKKTDEHDARALALFLNKDMLPAVRMKARRGTGKAIVALARKILGVIYRTLKEDLIWEDFSNGVLRDTVDCA